MSFHEVRLPEDISPGAVWGGSYSTIVIVTGAGFEQRLQQWSGSRRVGRIDLNLRTREQAIELVAFFEARAGRAYGFRYKDWHDFEATDEPLDHNEATTVQLTRTYSSGGVDRVRNIYKPVAGTVTLEVNGSPYTSFLLDEASGTVYLAGALGAGDVLTWSGQFDVPVRFDTDIMEMIQQAPDWRDWSGIPIVEVREAPTPVSPTISPLDASVSGALELYLRSDQVAGANGAAVSSWPDLGPNNWDAAQGTASNQPTVLSPGSSNGTKLVRFDGADAPNGDTMGFAMGVGNYPSSTNGMTMYFYGDFKAAVNGFLAQVLFSDDTGGRPELVLDYSGAGTLIGWNDALGTHNGSSYITGVGLYTWVFEPPAGTGTGRLYHDGVELLSATWSFTTGVSAQYILSGNSSNNACTQMDLGAVVWFSAAHDAATRLGIEMFLRSFFED